MDLAAAFFLGLLQGITEWLPISSSGHLAIASALFHFDAPAQFQIAVMAGTTLALLAYFRKRIAEILRGLLSWKKESADYVKLIIIAGIPTAIIGFAFKRTFELMFSSAFLVSLMIIVTGAFLLFVSKYKANGKKLDSKAAAIVGTAQGIAIAPGISRSGSTIGAALLLGIEPAKAAEFSFFIGAPAMMIASILETLSAPSAGVGTDALLIGICAAFVAGYASIGAFMRILKEGKLHWFGYYCIGTGAVFALATSGLV